MSEPENNQVNQLYLVSGQQAVVTREEWRVEFNRVGEVPQITRNGQACDVVQPVGTVVLVVVKNPPTKMSGNEDDQVIQLLLQASQQAVVTREG